MKMRQNIIDDFTAIIIIDFDNTFKKEIEQYSIQEFEFEIKEIIRNIITLTEGLKYILIRLYGGWHKDNILTNKASQIQQLIYSINTFPVILGKEIIHGSIELASSLFSIPDYTWGYTYKEKDGISRIRIDHSLLSDTCNSNKDQCAPLILYRFTSKKDKVCHVDSCTLLQKNVIKGIEQKMVDTIIACDLITFSNDENIMAIFIYSDDFDHLPSLAMAASNLNNSKKEKVIRLYVKNPKIIDLVEEILSPFKIQIHKYE